MQVHTALSPRDGVVPAKDQFLARKPFCFRASVDDGKFTFIQEGRNMSNRPKDWQKIINAEAEVCHWIAPDGTRHPCTDDENAEVRRELLIMRTTSDKRRRQWVEER